MYFLQPIQQIKSIQKIKVEHDQKIMDNNLLKIEQNIEKKRNNVGRIDSIQTFDAKNEKELLRQIESQSIAKRCGVGKDVLELPRPMKRPYDMVCLCELAGIASEYSSHSS
jgi:hypothetical protein